jgi:hypothetical protein
MTVWLLETNYFKRPNFSDLKTSGKTATSIGVSERRNIYDEKVIDETAEV